VVNVTMAVSNSKDSATDQELFDFLGESSTSANGSQKSDGRPSSSASGRSQRTPELPVFVAEVGLANGQYVYVSGAMSVCLSARNSGMGRVIVFKFSG